MGRLLQRRKRTPLADALVVSGRIAAYRTLHQRVLFKIFQRRTANQAFFLVHNMFFRQKYTFFQRFLLDPVSDIPPLYSFIDPFVHILKHIENHLFDTTVGMCGQVIFDGLHGDFGGQLVREAELSSGYAAEGDAFETVFIGQQHNGTIARSQLFLLQSRWDAVRDNGSDRVDDVFARKVISLRDFGNSCGFQMPLLLHQLVTLLAQLHARSGMDGVVDALVQGMETAQHLRIGGVHDGIHAETGDVALP